MIIPYEAVIGSKMKGNATPESDTDTMGFFIATNEEIGGFDWNVSKETVTNASPEGDDYTYYEVRKFLRLAAKSTPAILPALVSNQVIATSSLGNEGLEAARGLVSVKYLRQNSGYVLGKLVQARLHGNFKNLLEAFYIGELTLRWLAEGFPREVGFDADWMFGGHTFEQFIGLAESYQDETLEWIAMRIQDATANHILPEVPDFTQATNFLKYVRNNIG